MKRKMKTSTLPFYKQECSLTVRTHNIYVLYYYNCNICELEIGELRWTFEFIEVGSN